VTKSLRIPGILDLVLVDEAEAILALARDRRLDRDYRPGGQVLNRLLIRRIRRVLHLDGAPLPPVAPRGGERPAARQAEIEAQLDVGSCSEAHLQALAESVLGRPDARSPGPLVQEILGRLFRPGYVADAKSFEDACLLDAAVRSNNPLRQLYWWASGRIVQSRGRLAERAGNDAAALHTTAIAVHNLVGALQRMRELAARPGALGRIPAAQAASRCLVAPEGVLRQARSLGRTAQADFRPGTLVLLRLESARARTLRHDLAFMSDTWSRCPAAHWVPRLLAAVWERAASEHGLAEPRAATHGRARTGP
jgi:hypothetical protein